MRMTNLKQNEKRREVSQKECQSTIFNAASLRDEELEVVEAWVSKGTTLIRRQNESRRNRMSNRNPNI